MNWLVGWLADWPLVGWLVGCVGVCGWLVGWLVGWLEPRIQHGSPGFEKRNGGKYTVFIPAKD